MGIRISAPNANELDCMAVACCITPSAWGRVHGEAGVVEGVWLESHLGLEGYTPR